MQRHLSCVHETPIGRGFLSGYGQLEADARALPTYSFTKTERGLEEVAKDSDDLGVRFDGPIHNVHPFVK
jgi:hypothetical protein